jgi:hypothetical protein
VASELSNIIPNTYIRISTKVAVNGISLVSWIACPAFAAVKQGHFEEGMAALKSVVQIKSPKIASYLPKKLDTESEKSFSYLAEHLGSIAKTSMFVGTLALPWVGSPYLALGIFAPIAYQAIDYQGWVSRKTSLFMETYMPTIASSGALIGGGPVIQGIAALSVLSYFPAFNKFLQQKIDKLAKQFIDLPGPSIEEIDAPVFINKHLSFEQINKILNAASPSQFTVNAAHCSKPVWAFKELPKNSTFSKFLELFKTVKWKDKYSLLKKPFSEDDRFIDYLRDHFRGYKDLEKRFKHYLITHAKEKNITEKRFFPHQFEKQITEIVNILKTQEQNEELQKDADELIQYCSQILVFVQKNFIDRPLHRVNLEDILFEYYLDIHTKGMKIPKEEFLANQLEKQMTELVKMLKGKRRVEGSQKDADEAIHYCSQILPYLLKLNLESPSDRLILEDILVKLGVEGGEYCARGVKRASKEIVNGILQQLTDGAGDPIKDYERQWQQGLEAARNKLLNSVYQGFVNVFISIMKGGEINDDLTKEVTDRHAVALAQDVHTLDLYRIAFAFGVIPLSDYERNSMGFAELNLWGSPAYPFREFRMNIYEKYYQGIDDVIKELGHIHFSTYICAVIEQNTALSEAQKEEIIDKFTECNQGSWTAESTQSRFNRLACVMLGILNYETINEDWVEIDSSDLPLQEVSDPVKKTDTQDSDDDWEVV